MISKIKKEFLITETDVKNSVYFPDIEERYRSFSKENILTVSYTDVIVDFDASLIGSALSADYILFENQGSGYNHLCIAVGGDGKRYAESFFYNPSDLYIRGQHVVRIEKVKIYDADNNLFLEDTLI